MNNPLYANTVRYFLQFENVSDEWFEIFEPVYSDANTLNIEQQANSYGRDIRYKDGKLRFINAYHIELSEPQIINPQGDTSNHLSHLLGWWFYVLNKYGFGAKVNYKENINGIDTDVYGFDLKGDNLTDYQTYVECELIDTGAVADVKRTLETSFNAFSDKSWDGTTIVPMPTFNYLARGIPDVRVSKWKASANQLMFSDALATNDTIGQAFFNQIRIIEKAEIKNTLTYFTDYIRYTGSGTEYDSPLENLKIIKAMNPLTNITAKLRLKLKIEVETDNGVASRGRIVGKLIKGTEVYSNFNTSNEFEFLQSPLIGTQSGFPTSWEYDDTVIIDMGNLPRNNFVYFMFTQVANYKNLILKTTLIDCSLEITATNNPPDIVIPASRIIDLIKQTQRFRGNIPVTAPLYDVGGVHYDNAVITKRMISRKTDSFNITPKKVFDSLIEPNNHTEMFNDEIYINHHAQFYKNVQIGTLLAHPDRNYNVSINPKSTVNVFDIGFGTYEQDRTTSGTSESIHTQAEWRIIEPQSEDKFSRKFEFVRDGLAFQKAKDLEVNNPTTSTQDDDLVYAEKMTPLAPNSFGVMIGVFLITAGSNVIEILNTDSDGESNDYGFTWDSLGIGATCEITLSGITSQATVTAITATKLTLTTVYPFTGTGDYFLSIKYFYTGVQYQTKTNQGYTLISGVSDKFSNFDYTLGRIYNNYFREQSANYAMYCQKDIVCGYFKSIPETRIVLTQRNDELNPISENGVIAFNSLPLPLIDGYVINFRAVATYEQIKSIRDNYRINRGFISYWDRESERVDFGFIKTMAYNPLTGEVTGKFERKYTPPTLTITGTIDNLLVNDTPYNLSGVMDWWIMRNGFLTLYGENSIPISKEYEYNLVTLNGVTYSTYDELSDALSLLT